MTNRGQFAGVSQVLGWRDAVPQLAGFKVVGLPTQPLLTNATGVGRYVVNASGKVHYNGFVTFGSLDTFGNADYWGIRLPVPANRSSNGADLPTSSAWAWQGPGVSNLNLPLTPTLADPQNPFRQSDEDYWVQFFLSEMLAAGTATIPNGSTSVTVTHGVGTTPNVNDFTLNATAQSTNGPGQIWIDTITPTQFNLNCKNLPGASGLTVGWKIRAWPNSSATLDLLVNHARPWLWAAGMTLGWSLVYEARR